MGQWPGTSKWVLCVRVPTRGPMAPGVLAYLTFVTPAALGRGELEALFLPYDLKRLEMYSRNMVDYHLIMDLIPAISRLYFLNQLGDLALSAAQSVGYWCSRGGRAGRAVEVFGWGHWVGPFDTDWWS